jgi:nuclear receptor interaction protein
MKPSIYDRILRRELGDESHYSRIPGVYGSKEWIDEMDIVNELGGHTGCVNALKYVLSIMVAVRFTSITVDGF